MNKLQIITVLLLLSFLTAFSQTKQIKGDTIFWYKRNIELLKTLELKDFEKSSNEFNFRFSNHGQVIEISKDSSEYKGIITNYIYHYKKANRNKVETLSNKIILSSKQAEEIYNIVHNSEILELPSDKYIKNWQHGADGTTYIIEHTDKYNYWFKNYWTPSSQDSIPEAQVVENLVYKIDSLLNLQKIYSSFKNSLPKRGCYNSGGMVNMCYTSNSTEFGYSGATKMPLGFYSSYNASYIGKVKVNLGTALQYNFDNDGFHHLNFQTSKWNIFYKKPNIYDFLSFNYQDRKLNIDEDINKFQNYQIKYGFYLKKNIGIGIGLDYISGKYEKFGNHLYGYKYFSKSNISTILTTSIFDNQFNYKAEIFKSFYFKSRFLISRLSIGLAYEDFMNYKDLYFNFRILL
ncbi:MAG: hypothetical protein V4666_02515 [Bacteroidota bacterium]